MLRNGIKERSAFENSRFPNKKRETKTNQYLENKIKK